MQIRELNTLLNDISLGSSITRNTINVLYKKLIRNFQDPKMYIAYRIWKKLYVDATGLKLHNLRKLKKDYSTFLNNQLSEDKLELLLLVIHTYIALIAKMLTWRILVSFFSQENNDNISLVSKLSYSLRDILIEIETKDLLVLPKLKNPFKDNCFSWYLEILDQELEEVLEQLYKRLNSTDVTIFINKPELVSEFFRLLYYNLVNKHVRKALGEFYTPLWLAELLIEEVEKLSPEGLKKILDPGCGFGIFLTLYIKKLSKKINLKEIIYNVRGIDLNPLAVLISRAAYIIACLKLLIKDNSIGNVEVPIYIADAMSKSKITYMLTGKYVQLSTPFGKIVLPAGMFSNEIANTTEINKIESIHKSLDDFIVKSLASMFSSIKPNTMSESEMKKFKDILSGILAGFVLTSTWRDFDILIGNPPWINWEDYPEEYRKEIRELLNYYKLLTWKAKVGAVKIDVASIYTYVVIDKFLKIKGIMGFIIPQSLLKSKSAEGFRRMELPDGTRLKVLKIYELSKIQPFGDAQVRATIIVLKKGDRTSMPVECKLVIPYSYNKRSSGRGKLIHNGRNSYIIVSLMTAPITNDIKSPWISAPSKVLKALKKIIRHQDIRLEYKPREGVNTGGANGIFWLRIVKKLNNGTIIAENVPEYSRKNIMKITNIKLEPDLIYPLARARDIDRWKFQFNRIYILVPHSEETGISAIQEGVLKERYPFTYNYLNMPYVASFLKSRRVLHRWGGRVNSWYSLFEIGKYTFAKYKVAYKGEVATDIQAVVLDTIKDSNLGEKIIIPDQTIHFIPTNIAEEAYYLCAILNSIPVRALYHSLMYKHPSTFMIEYLKIPKYNPEDPIHKVLAMLSKKMHEDPNNPAIEKRINLLVSKIYGITSDELLSLTEYLNEFP